MTTRARLLFLILIMVLGCDACDAVLGLTGVPSEATNVGDSDSGLPVTDGAPVTDGGTDAPIITQDAAWDATTADAGPDAPAADAQLDAGPDAPAADAQLDAGPDAMLDAHDAATKDGGSNDLSWAEWPMPNSPKEVEAGAPHLESYTLGEGASAGTMTDNVTKLVWQQTPTNDAGAPYGQSLSWDDAVSYCATLSLAGEQDWRLPTVIELVSLVDYDVMPAINRSYFPDEPGNYYWSATPYAGEPGMWFVDFETGMTNTDDPSTLYGARCVRGGEGPPYAPPSDTPIDHYVAIDGGSAVFVYDARTGLTWQQTPIQDGTPNPSMTQTEGIDYCAGLMVNGAPGRLPTVGELQTLFDYNANTIAATDPTFFPTAAWSGYWSSTPEAEVPDASWGVPFGKGGTFIDGPAQLYYVRCVH